MLLLNLLLAMVWLLLTGQFTASNFLFGFVIGYGLLWLFEQVMPPKTADSRRHTYVSKVIQVLAFGLFFLWELIRANMRVAIDVLRPTPRMKPAVVAVPLRNFSDAEITLLANFITLTPGTLSLDIVNRTRVDHDDQGSKQDDDTDEQILYIHAMHAGDTQAAIERFSSQIQNQLAHRVQEVMQR